MDSDKHATDEASDIIESGCKCGGRCKRLRSQPFPSEQGAGAEPEAIQSVEVREGQPDTGHRPATGCSGHS